MPKVAVPIRVTNSLPEPKIPQPFTEPSEISGHHFEGPNWLWNGKNIDLVRFEECKTISEQLIQFWQCYEKKIMRPLQAGELKQMEPHIDLWPQNWPERVGNGRIFFAGTIYTIVYENAMHHDLIWCAAYNEAHTDWEFDCVPVETQLRKADCFACVSYSHKSKIPDYPAWPKLPNPRTASLSVRGRAAFVR